MKAALLDRNGKVIGEVFDAPERGNSIRVAGGFTSENVAINIKVYKISRSVKNLKKAQYEQPLSKIGDLWTFFV